MSSVQPWSVTVSSVSPDWSVGSPQQVVEVAVLGAHPCALAPLHVPQLSRGHAVVDLAHSDLSHYLVEDLRGPAGGLAADADGFHDMEVLLDVFAPVEVERV